jgi:hypothetical protein
MAPYTILFRQVFIFFFFPGDGKFLRVISEKKKKQFGQTRRNSPFWVSPPLDILCVWRCKKIEISGDSLKDSSPYVDDQILPIGLTSFCMAPKNATAVQHCSC